MRAPALLAPHSSLWRLFAPHSALPAPHSSTLYTFQSEASPARRHTTLLPHPPNAPCLPLFVGRYSRDPRRPAGQHLPCMSERFQSHALTRRPENYKFLLVPFRASAEAVSWALSKEAAELCCNAPAADG